MIDLGFRLGIADFVLSQRQPDDNRCLEDCVQKDSKARAQRESAEGKMIQYLLCASSCCKCFTYIVLFNLQDISYSHLKHEEIDGRGCKILAQSLILVI